MAPSFARRIVIVGAVGVTALAGASLLSAQSPDCNPRDGCVGQKNGMRVFSSNPTVKGIIGRDEAFIDLGTKQYDGKHCENGVIRIGRNTNRVLDPTATRDTPKQAGSEGGRPIQGCAP